MTMRIRLMILTLALALSLLGLGCEGTVNSNDDDADDDDAADDDAADDDDADDDDAADDDTADDDDADDDDADDDSGPDCPLVCDYYDGWTTVEIVMPTGGAMEFECPTWADVIDCEIAGRVDCPTPDGAAWELIGEAYPGGTADGTIEATGPQGPVSWPWTGSTTGKDLQGAFSSNSPQGGSVDGTFQLYCTGVDSESDPESGVAFLEWVHPE